MRWSVLLLAVLLFFSCACGETTTANIWQVIAEITQWDAELMEWSERTEESESGQILIAATQSLLLYNNQCLAAASGQNYEIELIDGVPATSHSSGTYAHVKYLLEDDHQEAMTLEVLYCDDYIYLTSAAYDTSGESTDFQMVEIARRPSGEQLLLLIQYNADFGSTARYAALKDDQGTRSIQTETFGRVFDVNLDVAAWKDGADFEKWGRALLYEPQ